MSDLVTKSSNQQPRHTFAMSSRHSYGLRILMMLCGVLLCLPAMGQAENNLGRAKLPRPNVKQPAAEAPVNPRLEKVLDVWAKSSKRIKRLEGNQSKYHYDHTFQVLTVSVGKFWFEAPDRGRIDFQPVKVPAGEVKEIQFKGKKRKYKVQAANAERWISDGDKVVKIDDAEKTYQEIPIPAELQGAKVMNGPLPFLFGLPPEEAKRRFALKLLKEDKTTILLQAIPKLPADAQNYDKALIVLDKKLLLPTRVKLYLPGGQSDETYLFKSPAINKNKWLTNIFKGSPFAPRLFGFKKMQAPVNEKVANRPPGLQPNMPQQPRKAAIGIPNVIGDHWKVAQGKCKQTQMAQNGYKVVVAKGKPAPNPDLKHTVYDVQVDKTAQKIRLVLYLEPEEKKN